MKFRMEVGGVRYFILRQHPFFSEGFQLEGWQGKINPSWICAQNFHKTPIRCVLTASMKENTPFPEIVKAPFFLMSDMMMDVAKMYGESVYKRDVVVVNEQEQQSRHYHLALLETVQQGYVLFGERNLFSMDINKQNEIIVSQDFAESILRRGAVGIALEEIDIKKEALYGK